MNSSLTKLADSVPPTDFYNRYLLQTKGDTEFVKDTKSFSPASDTEVRNILKDKYSLSFTDYEKLKLAEQYNKLAVNSLRDTNKLKEETENLKVYNMSLKMLVQNASKTYIQIINELSNYYTYNDKRSLNQIGYILTKGENLIYIGLLVLMIAFSMWLIDITS